MPLSSLLDYSIHVPKIFPTLTGLPEKDLPLDEAAIAIYAGDGAHLLLRERRSGHAFEVSQVVTPLGGERDGNRAALGTPLHAHHCRMHAQAPGDIDDHGV